MTASDAPDSLDARGAMFTLILCSMGTPMLGVSYMATQLGPYLALFCFALAALIAAECGRLIVVTCDMLSV